MGSPSGASGEAPATLALLISCVGRKLVLQQLSGLGYRVIEAANGFEARAMLEAVEDIALLVSDTVMPAMGGRELAAAARSLRPTLPILLITGYATGDAPPGTPYIPTLRKPFERAGLDSACAALRADDGHAPRRDSLGAP